MSGCLYAHEGKGDGKPGGTRARPWRVSDLPAKLLQRAFFRVCVFSLGTCKYDVSAVLRAVSFLLFAVHIITIIFFSYRAPSWCTRELHFLGTHYHWPIAWICFAMPFIVR